MRQNMAQFKDSPNIAEAHWYEIDETTHGSVVTYHSKEAYETNLATQKAVSYTHLTLPTKQMV